MIESDNTMDLNNLKLIENNEEILIDYTWTYGAKGKVHAIAK